MGYGEKMGGENCPPPSPQSESAHDGRRSAKSLNFNEMSFGGARRRRLQRVTVAGQTDAARLVFIKLALNCVRLYGITKPLIEIFIALHSSKLTQHRGD